VSGFNRDYAGGKDLNVFSLRNHVYFGRHEDGTLENEFSGNLIEVCPTGVFTDKHSRIISYENGIFQTPLQSVFTAALDAILLQVNAMVR